jgi:glycosyltransferase involved in cell wall biosynthesis
VLLPTRNSMPYLSAHVERVRRWMDMVEEVIVVDSESTDGTAEFLQDALAGPKLRFFDHPPGLYESWNFGIARARARYLYVSTVGDGVDRLGLTHLIEIADREKADVVVSPPRFIHTSGRKPKNYEWPIHWLIENAGITEPRRISAMQAFLVTSLFIPSGILGSSASNLYRTETVQRYPFPANFGRQGDTAWALENALRVRWALTPHVLSDFVVHGYPEGEGRVQIIDLKRRLFELAEQSREAFKGGALTLIGNSPGSDLYFDLKAVLSKLTPLEEEMTRLRKDSVPWALRPTAWKVRRKRNLLRLPLRKISSQIAAMDPCVDFDQSRN